MNTDLIRASLNKTRLQSKEPALYETISQILDGLNSVQSTTTTISGEVIPLNRGGTNSNLSATGGTSQVLKQVTIGASITVGQLASTDLSDVSSLLKVTKTTFTTTNLTSVAVDTGISIFFTLSFVRIVAPSGDIATLLWSARGGSGVGYAGGWFIAGTIAPTAASFTMAGTAAEDYQLTISSGNGHLSIAKNSAGTLTGTTTVDVISITF